MNYLPPQLKIKALKGLSQKMKMPKLGTPSEGGIGAQLERKVNPDYSPLRKRNLTKRLF